MAIIVGVQDPIIQKVEKVYTRGRVVGDFLDWMVALGIELLKSAMKNIEKMEGIKAKLDETINIFS